MDKKRLNNEIVLCRSAVRKAKVAVIRKILRKMKILKTCKVEGMREKKLKKSERLFEKVQIIKKIKLDDVTKFALRNSNLEVFLKGSKVNLKERALISLAQHEAVVKKINSVREQIPNWQVELPLMVDSLGKQGNKKLLKKQGFTKAEGLKRKDGAVTIKEKSENIEKEKIKKGHENAKKILKPVEGGRKSIRKNANISEELSDLSEKIEKIDDPFFIEKKVVAPKLTTESLLKITSEGKSRKPFLKKEAFGSELCRKPIKGKKDWNKLTPQVLQSAEEKLHPSWAAKKVKLIEPFQGKKIKFSDD